MSEKAVYSILLGISGFFVPLYTLLFWMFVFVIADLVSGLWAAKRRGELLSSSKLKRTISKLLCYASVIVLFQGLDSGVLPFIELRAAQIATALICGVELYSNLENLYTITKNRVFYILTQFTNKTIHEKTGVRIDDEKNGQDGNQ